MLKYIILYVVSRVRNIYIYIIIFISYMIVAVGSIFHLPVLKVLYCIAGTTVNQSNKRLNYRMLSVSWKYVLKAWDTHTGMSSLSAA